MTTAVKLIREAADNILKTPKIISKDFGKSTITIEDTEQLLDGFKLLFKSSDYDEQVRLLTLAPSNWGRPQIQDFFDCNEWQARKALLLRSSYGRLSRVTNFNGNQPMDPRLIDEIKKFYVDDGISRQSSNKKDVMHVNKEPVSIRYMSMPVGQAYTLFMQKLTERNSSESVCKSAFYSLRPKWVKLTTPHDVCECIYHANFDFLIKVHIWVYLNNFI